MKKSTNNNILFAFAVISVGLLSCGTVRTTTVSPDATSLVASDSQPASAPEPIVVRSAIVPDDLEPTAEPVLLATPKPVRKPGRTVMEPIADDEPASTPTVAPTKPSGPEPTEVVKAEPSAPATPTTTPSATRPSATVPAAVTPSPAAIAPATPPVAAVPAETTPAAAAPTSITPAPAVTADAAEPTDAAPSTAPPPVSVFNDPSSWLKNPKAILQASIGGMPLWLVVLLGLLALISLVIVFRGKKQPEQKEEPIAT